MDRGSWWATVWACLTEHMPWLSRCAHSDILEGSDTDINANWNLVNYRHARASQLVLVVKNLHANTGDARDESSIPRLGRSPGGGHGDSLQYSCLENPMDEDSGGLQSMGSHRIRHNWSDWAHILSIYLDIYLLASSIVREQGKRRIEEFRTGFRSATNWVS